jgi:prepilin-type N-terminal cleavage/methylation domain-containing protein
MINNKKVHSAFSLLEVIFVLVILGIVASIGSSILVQVYESYITQNAVYKVNAKTELVANQIVNRLSYAIPGTTLSKDTTKLGQFTEGTDWIKLKNIPAINTNFTTIEWIGYDNDSFSAQAQPEWSGLANYETSTQNQLNTPGSNFPLVTTIVDNLSNHKVQLTQNEPAAILFRQRNNYYTNTQKYSPACMGLVNENNTTCIWPVRQGLNVDELLFTRLNEPKIITERYKLAWSAYAIVPETIENNNGLNDLFLYYNYQPWNNEKYTDGTRRLLMKNVSVFKFTENGGIIQFKLCVQEKIGTNFPISTCKEKVVLR